MTTTKVQTITHLELIQMITEASAKAKKIYLHYTPQQEEMVLRVVF